MAAAELFSGNNLIVMVWASRSVSTLGLLRHWTMVFYARNLVAGVGSAAPGQGVARTDDRERLSG